MTRQEIAELHRIALAWTDGDAPAAERLVGFYLAASLVRRSA